jgi:predicted ester cyclase
MILKEGNGMSVEENKALVRQAYDFLNQKQLPAFFDLLALDYIEHMLDGDMNRDKAIQYEKTWLSAFPDFRVTIIEMVAEGDKVAVRLRWQGTHLGEFMGIQPSINRIDFLSANTIRITGGKLTELWNVADILKFMRQLGVVSPK